MHLLIIEDENRIARRLTRMAQDFFAQQLGQITHRDSLDTGKAYLQEHAVDLLLLDLNLNGEDGFEVLPSLTAAPCHVIICSAYHDQAIRAFEYGVLDFVPKPFSRERLNRAFSRIVERGPENNPKVKYLSVQKKGLLHLIEVNDISYVQGAGTYAQLVLQNGQTELHNKSLDRLGQLLPASFFRIHKSYLVDLTRIKSIRVAGGGKYTAILQDDTELPIGRSKYAALKAKL